jgi:hypothetical protein
MKTLGVGEEDRRCAPEIETPIDEGFGDDAKGGKRH